MHIHILGICGTFMGGVALLARAAGHKVTGCDANVYPPMSTQLEAQGIELMQGYDPAHLQPAPDLVVVGNALSRGNPAVEYVLNQGLPYVSGPQWLADHVLQGRWVLAAAGTHGKTTTSSMLAWVLEHAGMSPGFLIGGVPQNFGVSARLGGTPDNPSVIMESVHHFFKTVSGKPLIRPAWYYDVEQQGEGIADVTTHLIDLINWQCFPDETIHYQSDVTVNAAKHWPTPITLAEFSQSTQIDSFPAYLNRYIKNDVLEVMANGSLNYTVKGICIGMKVTWNYTPPTNGGDTFTSIKKGSKIKIFIKI